MAEDSDISYKNDKSPTTDLELEIETLLHDRLAIFSPKATIVGEETGGRLTSTGLSVAIDPIDGTWAFLNGLETFTTTLAIFRDAFLVVFLVALYLILRSTMIPRRRPNPPPIPVKILTLQVLAPKLLVRKLQRHLFFIRLVHSRIQNKNLPHFVHTERDAARCWQVRLQDT